LEDFLIAHVHIQLEKFLINKKNFLFNKKKFLLPLEKVLIANRNFSNNKRGRKPRREASGEAQSEEPQIDLDCLEIDSEIGNESEGANALHTPTFIKEQHEVLFEEATEKLEEVEEEQRRITGKHAAVHANETLYHIANGSAIGNDDFRLHAPGQLTLAAKGATHGNDTTIHLGTGMGRTHGDHHTEDHQQITSQQAPGTPSRPLAAGTADVTNRHGDAGSVQAQPSLVAPEPAQAVIPPTAGSTSTTTAQVSGRRRQPRGNKLVPIELSLLGEEVKRWIEEARGVKVHMTENNVKACNALAEQDGVSLEALAAYFEYVDQKWTVSLVEAAGLTEKESKEFLSFESNWPQLKRKLKGKPAQAPPPDWVPADNDRSTKAELWRQAQRERSGK